MVNHFMTMTALILSEAKRVDGDSLSSYARTSRRVRARDFSRLQIPINPRSMTF